MFRDPFGSGNIDRPVDYVIADDTIRLENSIFTGLALGTLRQGQFEANANGVARGRDARIIQDTDSGQLYFDRDGQGGATRQQFAVLDNEALLLTRFDFVVV